ncbi:MAG: efflux RND transporter permease subunit [bacterium]|nr:efflux RND transporter permease subunit [bacterium]
MKYDNEQGEDILKEKRSFFDRIIFFSLKQRRMVLVLAAIVVAAGSFIISNMPIDVLPDLNRPVVTVLAEAHGLASGEVERVVVVPLESVLNGAPGVNRIRSVAKRGIAILQVEFDWGSDIYRCRQVVSEKITSIQRDLPGDIRPILGPISSIMGEIQLIGLHSKNGETSLMELRTLADWTIRKRLLSIPGLSNAIVMGGEAKEYKILIDSKKMANQDISFGEIVHALQGLGLNTTGGFIENKGRELVIRNIGSIYDISEIGDAVIGFRLGEPVPLRKVAKIKIGHKVKRGDVGINGKPGVILAVLKQPGVSTIELTAKIEKSLKNISEKLSNDIIIMPELFKQSDFINRAVENVEEAIYFGSFMVALVLFIFLWNFRTTAITLIALPISLIVTILILRTLGYGINTMTLGGLAVGIGLLVDDAIVDTENIFRRLKNNAALSAPQPVLSVIYHASSEIRNSIILATAVVALAFVPLLFLPGVEGRLFQPMAVAFIVALFVSLAVALTLTPVLCYYLLPNSVQKGRRDSFTVRWLKYLQEINLRFLLDRPLVPLAVVLFFFICAGILAPFLGREFLPSFNEGTLTLDVITPAGTSMSESIKKAREIEKICMGTRGVEKVSRRTGRSELDEHAEGVHYSEMDILLDAEGAGRTRKTILKELRSKFKKLDRVSVNIGQPISHRLDHLLSGVKAEVALFIYGQELEALLQYAYQARSIAKDIPGVEDLLIETQSLAPELKISVLHDRASRYGIPVGSLTETLEHALNGAVVGKVFEENRIFDIRVQVDEQSRSSVDRLKNFIIKFLPDATPITLGKTAEIYESKGPYEIKRENGNRRIAVQFNVAGSDLNTVVKNLEKKLKKELKLPSGYDYDIGGRYASQVEAGRLIALLALVSLVIIIGLLYAYFRSVLLTVQVLLNIPLAFIGGVYALYLMGTNLSIASLVGFIALAGIASRNGILMISHFIHLMEQEKEPFSKSMVIRGALERLVPVLMTAGTAIIALIPILMTGNDAPGKEMLFPISLVIVGGLLSSTMLDLVLTPVVFYHAGKRSRTTCGERSRTTEGTDE